MTTRRFPPPWSIEELNDACFVVCDRNGQALAYTGTAIAQNYGRVPTDSALNQE
jgi:hypothetical protein